MVKKLILVFIGCFSFYSHGSYDPKYDHCACQNYSLDDPKEQAQIITTYSPYAALKLVLGRLGERIQTVIAKKTTKRVAGDMVLIVKQFMLKFENCVIPDFRKKAFILHEELAEEITKIVASFSVSKPDIIAQLTELLWKGMREVFDESVHRQLVRALHKCITIYFVPQKREASDIMIASVAQQPEVSVVKQSTPSADEEKSASVEVEHKDEPPSVVEVTETINQSLIYQDANKTAVKADAQPVPSTNMVVADSAQPKKKKKMKLNVFDRLSAPIAFETARKNAIKKKLAAGLMMNEYRSRPRWRF